MGFSERGELDSKDLNPRMFNREVKACSQTIVNREKETDCVFTATKASPATCLCMKAASKDF